MELLCKHLNVAIPEWNRPVVRIEPSHPTKNKIKFPQYIVESCLLPVKSEQKSLKTDLQSPGLLTNGRIENGVPSDLKQEKCVVKDENNDVQIIKVEEAMNKNVSDVNKTDANTDNLIKRETENNVNFEAVHQKATEKEEMNKNKEQGHPSNDDINSVESQERPSSHENNSTKSCEIIQSNCKQIEIDIECDRPRKIARLEEDLD